MIKIDTPQSAQGNSEFKPPTSSIPEIAEGIQLRRDFNHASSEEGFSSRLAGDAMGRRAQAEEDLDAITGLGKRAAKKQLQQTIGESNEVYDEAVADAFTFGEQRDQVLQEASDHLEANRETYEDAAVQDFVVDKGGTTSFGEHFTQPQDPGSLPPIKPAL